MATSKYDSYVHEYESNGKTLYAVGHWDASHAQYFWPISDEVARKSGASGAFSRTVAGFGGSYCYTTRKSALDRARRIYGTPD